MKKLTSEQILKEYFDLFGKQGHTQIPNVSLIPENDSTLLYVNSGMFPLVPYFAGEPHPDGKRLMNVQRALRFFEDIDNIGVTNRHTTLFHMIGNWSLGDYFKKEQLPWIYEFFIDRLGLDPNRLYSTVFEGDAFSPRDEESISLLQSIYKKYGIDAKVGERIFTYGREDNWWKRGDAVGELGGPDSEIFYYIGEDGTGFGKSPAQNQDEFLEIGNNVFMQFQKGEDNSWSELTQKNVDFGGGLERIALVVQEQRDIFQTDNFWPIIEKIQELSGKKYGNDALETKSMRILADHIRSTTLIAMDGVIPSNKDQGYILRRLIRRMVVAGKKIGIERDLSSRLIATATHMLAWLYPELPGRAEEIALLCSVEEERFVQTLSRAQHKVNKYFVDLTLKENLSIDELAQAGFEFYQSLGYPIDIFLDDIRENMPEVDKEKVSEAYKEIFNKHQDTSRKGMDKKFKGGLADHSDEVIAYHTATHLLHKALRDIVGEHVSQQGSNITKDRLRFDFTHAGKLTAEQLEQVEKQINDTIAKKLPVNFVILSKEEAMQTGALHFFKEKYGDQVKIYYIGQSLETAVSKEFCGGPHVTNLSQLRSIELFKQENIGEGVMRIYARFTNTE